jgi:hypothetical protein
MGRGKKHCPLRIPHWALIGGGKDVERDLHARQWAMWNAQWTMLFPLSGFRLGSYVALFTQRPIFSEDVWSNADD